MLKINGLSKQYWLEGTCKWKHLGMDILGGLIQSFSLKFYIEGLNRIPIFQL